MCLAVPMRIVSIDGDEARCEINGIARTVSLFLMQHEVLSPGDVVVVHVGYAIQKVSEETARGTWELLVAALGAEDAGTGGGNA